MAVRTGPALIRALARALVRLFYHRVDVVGVERVPASGPLVIVANHRNALVDSLSARIEMELGELEPDEAAVFMEELGIAESGLDRVIGLSYRLLGLISFLTAGPDEVHDQRGERPVAQLVGDVLEPSADQVVALDGVGEDPHAAGQLGPDVPLGLKAFEELLDGGVVGRSPVGVEGVGDLPAGGGAVVPQVAEHGQLGVGDVRRRDGDGHASLPRRSD